MASELDVVRIELTIAYTFTNKNLLKEALTTPHKNEDQGGGVETREGNKRLAAIGDLVLKLFLTERGYFSRTDQSTFRSCFVEAAG